MSPSAVHWQAVLDAWQAVRRLPSLSAAVVQQGSVMWSGSAGIGGGVQVSYRIGSITKTMTAVLVLQLRDQGDLGLDDALGRFVPEVSCPEVTLRQLLSHTAGLPSEPAGQWWERTEGDDFAGLVARNISRIRPPAEEFHYSNLGYGYLGEVVARVSGAPWGELVAERIWQPLGMESTSLLSGEDSIRGYSVDHLRGTLSPEPATDTRAMAPAGQVWSTVTDLARFSAVLLGQREDVLAASSVAEMCTPQLPADGYGLGVRLFGDLAGHGGTMPGFQAGLWAAPTSGLAVAVLTNGTTGFTSHEFAEQMLSSDTPGPVEPWLPTQQVPDWAAELLGWWFWGNSAYELRWHNGRLEFHDCARGLLAEQFVLADDRIIGWAGYHRGETLNVVRRTDGGVGHLECATFVYTRTAYDEHAPIPGGVPTRSAQDDLQRRT